MIILIIIYCILFACLAYRRTDWAIYLIVALLPTYLIRFSVLGVPATLLETMILILFVAWLAKFALKKTNMPRAGIWLWPILAILLFTTLSAIFSPSGASAWGIWKAYFIEPLLFLIVFLSIIKTNKKLPSIFWALGVSAIYLSLIAISQKFTGLDVPTPYLNPSGSVDRVVGFFNYPNALGLYLGPIIILFTGFLMQKAKTSAQWIKLAVIILSFATIILAKSEGAILSVLIIWIVWALFFKKPRKITLTIIVIALILFFINPAINQFVRTKTTLNDYSGSIRKEMWQETTTMLSGQWLMGSGLAGYQRAIVPFHNPKFEVFLYPHNIVLNFWTELGLLGLLSFVWLAVLFFWQNIKGLKSNKILSATLIAIMAQIIIHGLVDVPYFKNDLSILFWIIIGISIITTWKGARVVE